MMSGHKILDPELRIVNEIKEMRQVRIYLNL